MQFSEIIKKVNGDKRLVPDLMKAENGNNFRAISESAILDVIDPILKEAGWYYAIIVKDQHLDIREAYGSKGKKLQFIATVHIAIAFIDSAFEREDQSSKKVNCVTEAVGMGIDDNDKAMGKAYTYAVKYALLKIFRLRYGDDADFESSKPLYIDKPKDEKEKNSPDEGLKNKKNQSKKTKEDKNHTDVPMSEKQRDYILGMMKTKKVPESEIIANFGCEPSKDEFIPMKVARAIIKWLEEDGFLPF